MKRLTTIGGSISGGIAACYLKMRFPDVEVVLVQKPKAKFPIVGESLTEFSTLILHEIGLGSYLEENHFHKYGLTFYFKEKIGDPNDLTYAVHEAMRIPPMSSNQINRFTLALRLRQRAEELGVVPVDGFVKDVSINPCGPNRVAYANPEGELVWLETDWIVDASGRARFLANKFGLKKTSKFQRSTFWFRLEGFDRHILGRLQTVRTPHHCFDPYYVTHHFFGRGNWIWAIPMRADQGGCRDLISIGIVYRPDLYTKDVSSVDDFLSQVAAEHPVVAQMVQSGRIVDTNIYRNYLYETAQSYSEHGWFIIGDAGDAVDPLYSTGIAMTSVQVKQVEAMIDCDRRGALRKDFVRDLERLYKGIRDRTQWEVSTLYEVMDDPFQSHIRVHLASALYFFVLLPAWLSGYITDRVGVRLMIRLLERGSAGFESLKTLLSVASRRLGPLPARAIRNHYEQSVNWELFGPSEEKIPSYFAKFCLFLASQRFSALARSGWHDWRTHLSLCLGDLFKAALFGVVIRRRTLKDLRIAKWVVNLDEGAE